MIDVSAAQAIARAKRYATSFDNTSTGPAGYEKTRREPATLTDRQCRTIEQRDRLARIADRLPIDRRSLFWSAVTSRLSGSPSDEAVQRVASLMFEELCRGEKLAMKA
jgi:hypothetical protein